MAQAAAGPPSWGTRSLPCSQRSTSSAGTLPRTCGSGTAFQESYALQFLHCFIRIYLACTCFKRRGMVAQVGASGIADWRSCGVWESREHKYKLAEQGGIRKLVAPVLLTHSPAAADQRPGPVAC